MQGINMIWLYSIGWWLLQWPESNRAFLVYAFLQYTITRGDTVKNRRYTYGNIRSMCSHTVLLLTTSTVFREAWVRFPFLWSHITPQEGFLWRSEHRQIHFQPIQQQQRQEPGLVHPSLTLSPASCHLINKWSPISKGTDWLPVFKNNTMACWKFQSALVISCQISFLNLCQFFFFFLSDPRPASST